MRKLLAEKHINGYRLQYWLYACLNKQFGTEVKFIRDQLHCRYAVNRHGFSITTNTLAVSQVTSFLTWHLKASGFSCAPDDPNGYSKTTCLETGVERLYVHFTEIPSRKEVQVVSFANWTSRPSSRPVQHY